MSWFQQGVELNIANGFYQTRSGLLSSSRCINWRPVVHEAQALSQRSLFMTEGIAPAVSGLDGPIRGMHELGGIPYVVAGNSLYRIDQNIDGTYSAVDLSTTVTGTIVIQGEGRVSMASGNGAADGDLVLVIVVPGIETIYYSTIGPSFGGLDGRPEFNGPAIDVAVINGLYVFLNENNKLFHSETNDQLTYSALSTFTLNETIDAIGLINFRNQLFVFGEERIIPFNFVGGVTFAFQSQFNAVKPVGLRGLHAKADAGEYVGFIGRRKNSEPAVYVYTGGAPQKISTEAIDYRLSLIAPEFLDDAFVEFYSIGGSDSLLVLAGDESYIYDITNNRWHENRSYIDGGSRRWRVNAMCTAYNKIFVGDYVSGQVGVLDSLTATEFGQPIHREVILPTYDNKGRYIQVKDVALFMDVGFGGEILMEFSDNGGVSWPNNAIERSAGAIGDYGRIVQWDRLGTAAAYRTLRFATSTTAQCHLHKVLVR